jgi:cytochrome c6
MRGWPRPPMRSVLLWGAGGPPAGHRGGSPLCWGSGMWGCDVGVARPRAIPGGVLAAEGRGTPPSRLRNGEDARADRAGRPDPLWLTLARGWNDHLLAQSAEGGIVMHRPTTRTLLIAIPLALAFGCAPAEEPVELETERVVTATIEEGESIAEEILEELEPGETATVTATITETRPEPRTTTVVDEPARRDPAPAVEPREEPRTAVVEPPPARPDPGPQPPVASPPAAVAAGSASQGGELFRARCASCHGADGSGDTTMGRRLEIGSLGASGVQQASDARLTEMIRSGTGEASQKAHQRITLTDEQVRDVIAFIRSLG